jgi:2-(1,2-epoxy-1,2-dihydrophenyl)acetyl-CoA isomerase
MQYSTILFDIENDVAHITLNRPDAANSINSEMGVDLMRAATYCGEDPMIRAVLISGSGRMFCGGGDLKEFAAQSERLPDHLKELTAYLHVAISRLSRLDAPVIAAVHGSAAGAGLSLVCSCDIVIAAENTRFTMAYTRSGLSPDGSSTYYLPRIVGIKRALELALTNRILSAQEALEWGIVTRLVPEEDLLDQAHTLAVQLAAGPTRALGAAKRLMHNGVNETLETQMEHESQAIADIGRTTDSSEGITAFLEKRAPRFKGK